MNPFALSAAALVLSIFSFAQDPEKEPAKPPAATAAESVKAWLESDGKDRQKLTVAVQAALKEGTAGIDAIAGHLPKDPSKTKDLPNVKQLDSLLTTFAFSYLAKEMSSGIVFAGQYSPLAPLMPYVGRFYLKLVVDTPEQFPERQRQQVVPALRDLYPKGPGEEAMALVKKIALDEEFEQEGLRQALSYALWGWGDKELATKQIEKLKKEMETGKEDDQIDAQQKLADVYYQLRDYPSSAQLLKEFFARAEKSQRVLVPNDYYNGACNMSLAGDIDGALAALEKLFQLQNSDKVDSSQRLRRSMFDQDPDLTNVRKHPKFAELVKAGFGEKGGDETKKDSGK